MSELYFKSRNESLYSRRSLMRLLYAIFVPLFWSVLISTAIANQPPQPKAVVDKPDFVFESVIDGIEVTRFMLFSCQKFDKFCGQDGLILYCRSVPEMFGAVTAHDRMSTMSAPIICYGSKVL